MNNHESTFVKLVDTLASADEALERALVRQHSAFFKSAVGTHTLLESGASAVGLAKAAKAHKDALKAEGKIAKAAKIDMTSDTMVKAHALTGAVLSLEGVMPETFENERTVKLFALLGTAPRVLQAMIKNLGARVVKPIIEDAETLDEAWAAIETAWIAKGTVKVAPKVDDSTDGDADGDAENVTPLPADVLAMIHSMGAILTGAVKHDWSEKDILAAVALRDALQSKIAATVEPQSLKVA